MFLRTKSVPVIGVQYTLGNINEIQAFIGADAVRLGENESLEILWEGGEKDIMRYGDWIVKYDDSYDIILSEEFHKWFERIG